MTEFRFLNMNSEDVIKRKKYGAGYIGIYLL